LPRTIAAPRRSPGVVGAVTFALRIVDAALECRAEQGGHFEWEAGGKTNSHLEQFRPGHLVNGFDDSKPRPHCPLGCTSSQTRRSYDRFGDAIMVSADDVPQIFGIESPRGIAEHHGQLAALRGIPERGRKASSRR
jgi:hypothetical protein